MSQVEPKDLDNSPEMAAYFKAVVRILVERHEKSFEEARGLVGRYFGIDVDPLERALVMHRGAVRLAEALARGSR